MKKIICICICISLMAGCGKTQVIERERVIEKQEAMTPENFTQERETLSIPFPKIWGKMTDEPMIKGYRLPRPTFGLGWWTVGTNNFVGVSALLLLAICAGKYLFFNKGNNNMVKIDPTSTVECVQSKAFETAAPTTPITVSGNVGIDPSATVQIAPNQQVAAVPSGDFNAVGKGEIECVPSKSAHLKVSNSDNIKVPLVGEFGTAVEAFAEATNAFKDATEKIGQVTRYQAEILDKTLQSEQRAIEFAENQSKITGGSINIPPTTDIPADDIDK